MKFSVFDTDSGKLLVVFYDYELFRQYLGYIFNTWQLVKISIVMEK